MPGPFEIAPEDVVRLGNGFTDAVNQLLQAEAAATGIAGSSLVLNRVETIPDGGVDAEITDAPAGGEWIPEGDSVWQFKRSNLSPKECAEEFGRAGWAQQKVAAGSAYVLVLGVSLSPKLLERRRVAILIKAEELGLNFGDGWLHVRDANALARWISLYPSLAVSRDMRGPGSSAIDFATWADARIGRLEWVPDEARQNVIEAIRSALSRPTSVDLRVEGAPGIGKSRLVLEALRDDGLAPLVAYIADEAEMTGEMFHRLVGWRPCVVLVVDRCPADRHGSLAERLPNDPAIKLITIGPIGHAVTRKPVIVVEPMPSEAIDKFASHNFPGLSNEDRRFVVDNSDGYPQLAEVFSRRVLDSETQLQAADLVTETDVRQFITDRRPSSGALRVAEGIALFEKLGWEGEASEECEQLARFLGISDSAMQLAGWELEKAGWLAVRGRYRAIAAHRLAVFLASRNWEDNGDRIVGELLDRLEEPMAFALFRRLADLGRYEPARNAMAPLLAPEGPLGSLEQLQMSGRAARLTELAIVLPKEVALHVHELLEKESEEELRNQPAVCRELAWALQKLAWHTDTFCLAAASLLRLAVAEPTFGNDPRASHIWARLKTDATAKWTSLFGTMLPATAAGPNTRMAYLISVAGSDDARERTLAIEAFQKVIAVWESVMVSGELQGGASVEARGTPQTWSEAWDYQIAAIDELGRLVGDPDPKVRSAAEDCLIEAINPLAGSGSLWETLEDVLARTPGLHGRVRHTVQSYESLFSGVDVIDDSDEEEQRHRLRMEALASLRSRLPDQDSRDTLQLALNLPRWDHPADRVERAVLDATVGFLSDHDEAGLYEFLSRNQPNAWEFGLGLASLPLKQDPTEVLVTAYKENADVLLGYLHRKTDTDPCAVETFLDAGLGRSMEDVARLEIARVGQLTDRTREIIDELVGRLPVADSAVRVRVTAEAFPEMLQRWIARLETQQDYDMVVKRVTRESRSNKALLGEIGTGVLELVLLRRRFPRTGRASWNWRHLAKAVLAGNEEAIAELVLDMIENPERVVTPGSTEVGELLGLAVQQSAARVWPRIGERLANGSWRLVRYAENWQLLAGVEPHLIETWVGSDADRARIVARVAPLGGDEPTSIARHLLAAFGDDDEVRSVFDIKLDCELQVGKRSAHIQCQIDRLNAWRNNTAEPPGVRDWARRATARLEMSKKRALRSEEERGW